MYWFNRYRKRPGFRWAIWNQPHQTIWNINRPYKLKKQIAGAESALMNYLQRSSNENGVTASN